MTKKVGVDKTNAYTVIKLVSKSNPNCRVELGHFYDDGCIAVNGRMLKIGKDVGFGPGRLRKNIYEFDLTPYGNDFIIWGVQPNFDLSKVSFYGYDSGHSTNDNNHNTQSSSVHTAYINRSWIDLNVTRNGVEGTVIHMDMGTKGLKGKNIKVISFLDSPKGVGVKDTNGNLCNTQGNVCVWLDTKADYEHTTWKDLTLFLPNNEIHPKPGANEYFLHTFIFVEGKALADVWSGSFRMTGNMNNRSLQQNNNGSSGGRTINGQGFIGKGEIIHVLPKENISQPQRDDKLYCFCNVGCAPVKVYIKYYVPNNPQPNNPFMQNMINQVGGWCLTISTPTNSTYLSGIKNYTYENDYFVFKDKKGFVVKLASDLSNVLISAGAFGSVKYDYRISESDYNKYAQLMKNFLALASMYEKKIEVEEKETMSTKKNRDTSKKIERGVWVKEYAMRYVTDEPLYWCDKCKEYDFRHVHYKKMY